jgi:subtilase family serine protease
METALAFAFILFFSLMAAGQQAATVPARVTQPVDLQNLVTLQGNTHPLARPEFDQGAAPDSLPTERILLVLQRSPEQEAALRKLLDEQQIKSSPNYHMWLTPEQFGEQFGPADADIQAVTGWLTSQGFQVNRVATGRTVIEFSGTAGAVRQAFHTEIHRYVVKGEEHWANASDPQIPAALKPVVAGFASLNNFPRKPMYRLLGPFSRSKATGEVRPVFTLGSNNYALGPTDFATIYNVLPLWNASSPIDGTGEQVAVVAQTNINIQDVADFRGMFSLPALSAQSNSLCQAPATTPQVPVNICLNGPDPGIIPGEETESDLDVQWSGGVAERATIDLVISESTEVTAGIDLSALYIIDNNLAPVMSESYGACEAFLGSGGNTFYRTLWEQGAAQGITVLLAAGDTGSAGCDVYAETGVPAAEFGLMVSGFASTPFDVAVGGTDFNDVNNWSTYWSTANNSTTLSSALSYIPETTWNDSCAQSGQTPCSTSVASEGTDLVAGGGGPSNCATSTWTSVPGGIEITCNAGVPKPSWQTGPGVPPDSVRDIPDVSLFASNGLNGSFYVFCEADALPAGESSCDRSAAALYFVGAGGTSVSAQAFAGIMALVNQKYGPQGNANYVLYPLAAKSGNSCPSNSSAVGNASCVFYDIQVGDNSVACVAGSNNCSNQTSSGYGILEVPSSYPLYTSTTPGWPTTAGYDLATGLGTVNVANLVNNWSSVSFTATTTALSLSTTPPTNPIALTHGQSANFTVTVGPTSGSGTPTGDVSLIGGPSGGTLGIGPFTLSGGAYSSTTTMLPGGTYNVTAHYAGDGTYGASDSSPVTVTVSPENSQTLLRVGTENCSSGSITYGTTASVPYGYNIVCSGVIYLGYWLRMDVTNSVTPAQLCYNSPAYQCPTGQVVVTLNGATMPATDDVGAPADNTPGTYTLNSQGFAEDQFIQLPVGTNTLVATYSPHPVASPPTACQGLSYCTSASGTDTITVTPAATTTIVTASPTSLPSTGGSATLTAAVGTSSIGLPPCGPTVSAACPTAGSVTFFNGSSLIGGIPTYTFASPTATTYASLTAILTATITTLPASIKAVYSGDSNYTTSTSPAVPITISTGAPDFSFPSATTIIITSPGQSGSETISASAVNGFTGTVNVTCAVPSNMTYSTCSLSPTSFSVPGGSTILTVNTTAPSLALRLFNRPRWFIPSAGALFACIFLLLISGKKRRVKLAFGLLVFALLAAAFAACGGSSSSSSSSTSGGTPTGNYTVTVTGTSTTTSGTLSHTLNVPVAVQ